MSSGGSPLLSYTIELSMDDKESWMEIVTVDSTITKCQVDDLVEGETFYFRVYATNKFGNSAPLESAAVVPRKGIELPSKPTGPIDIKEKTEDSVTIEWKPPANDGGAPIIQYIVEKRDIQKPKWQKAGKVDGSVTTMNITSLVNKNEYLFRVTAENEKGLSEPLEMDKPVLVESPFTVPSIPVGPLKAANITEDSMELSWGVPETDGGKPLTAYVIEARESGRTSWGRVAKISPEKTKHAVKNLVTGNEYHFRVRAVNDVGDSKPLEMEDGVVPRRKAGPPAAPESLRVTSVDKDKATVEWTPPVDDGGSKIKGFKIEKKGDKGRDWEMVASVGPKDTSHTITGLPEGKSMLFRVSAENEKGVGKALDLEKPVTLKAKQSCPTAPTGPLKVSDIQKQSVNLTWQKPSSDGGSPITAYIVEQREAWRTSWSKVDTLRPSVMSLKVPRLTEGTEYNFRVLAENAVGVSEPLELLEPVTPKSPYTVPSAPRGPLETAVVSKSSLKLSWKPSEQDGGQPIKHYVVERRDKTRTSWVQVDKVRPEKCELVVPNLLEGNEYQFRVFAENSEGASEPLETTKSVTPKKPAAKPSAPSGKLRTPKITENSVMLEWSPPVDDGGSRIQNYIIEQKDNTTGKWNRRGSVEGSTVTFTVPDLEEGKDYNFRVLAKNDAGTGPALETEAPVRTRKAVGKPGAPQGPLTPSNVTKDSVSLSWQAPEDDGASPITGYLLEKRDTQMPGWTKVDKIRPDKLTHKVTGLIDGHRYLFRVSAENVKGMSMPLEMKEPVTTKSPYGPPSAPDSFSVTGVTEDSVTLEWQPPANDGGSSITGYIIHKREISRRTWTEVDKVKARVTSYTVPSLVADKEYFFTVRAENVEGVGDAAELEEPVKVSKQMKPPSEPLKVQITGISTDSVTLQWQKPADSGGAPVTFYHVEQQEKTRDFPRDDRWEKRGIVDKTTFVCFIDKLVEDTEYFFSVAAENAAGIGPRVVTEPITPRRPMEKPLAPVGPLEISNVTEDSIKLSWQPPTDNGGSELTSYIVEKCDVKRGEWFRVARVKPNFTTSVVHDLIEGVEYIFRVSAENEAGVGPPIESEKIIPKSPYGPPGPPEGPIKVSKITSDSVTISWNAPLDDGGSLIKGYIIEKRDAARRSWISAGKTKVKNMTFTIDHLIEGKEYYFRVMAENGYGVGEPLGTDSPIVPAKVLTAPQPPAALRVMQTTKDSVVLSWDLPLDDGGKPVKGYVVEKLGPEAKNWVQIAKLKDNKIKITDLTEGEEYLFRVAAENEIGQSEMCELSTPVVPQDLKVPPWPPGRPEVSNVTKDSVVITWTAPENDGGSKITTYHVDRREGSSVRWMRVNKTKQLDLTMTIPNLLEGCQYEFRVIAENAEGLSEPSPPSELVAVEDKDANQAPVFSSPLQDTIGKENTKATMECKVQGKPKPTIQWYKDMTEIYEGRKYSMFVERDKCLLEIFDAKPDDTAIYECKATNKKGHAVTKALLTVKVCQTLPV
ncbi:twitchin-like [Lingula anatina]|uniref:Twitchin-like n=1 Tax=Lingula anatina TaxID=7574 RepID=A0A1S3KA32_LINAN|nr:twitchin-like [Lingula anatina]|eukprot:XP_013419362.1 twitchin-like [Lingula anatina]